LNSGPGNPEEPRLRVESVRGKDGSAHEKERVVARVLAPSSPGFVWEVVPIVGVPPVNQIATGANNHSAYRSDKFPASRYAAHIHSRTLSRLTVHRHLAIYQ
jgi:hypothetical protein